MVEKNTKKKVLVVGAGGLLGSEVMRHLSNDPRFEVKGATRQELDISKGMEVAIWIERLHPHFIINCAAMSNVDGCETDRKKAFAVNADGPRNLCLPLLEDVKATLIHISTDYVFDGEKGSPYVESDKVHPLGVYAESKLKGEEHVRRMLPDAIILRVQWLYGPRGKGFASQVVQQITRETHLPRYKFINDRVGNPTSVVDLAEAIRSVMLKRDDIPGGIYHVSSRGSCSWSDFGKAIFELNHIPESKQTYESISANMLKRPALRPKNTSFSCDHFEKGIGVKMSPWRDQLKRAIEQVRADAIRT